MIVKTLRLILSGNQLQTLRTFRDVVSVRLASAGSLFFGLFPDRLVLFLRTHMRVVRPLDYSEAKIVLDVESRVEYGTRLHSCAKEPETIDWIQTFFRPGDVYYDIGANVGAYALVAAKRFRGDVQVYAFEPSYPTFKQLCTNVVINDCQDCITPLQVALSDQTGIAVLNYSSLVPGSALHALGEACDYKGDKFRPAVKQPVLAFALDDLIRQFALSPPAHIKLDVDGIELSILRGAEKTLASTVLRSVLVEILEGDAHSMEVVSFLERCGLTLHSKHKYIHGGSTGPSSRIYNYIFHRQGASGVSVR